MVMRFRALAAFIEGRSPVPRKSVILTIDDGFRSAYQIAYPLLKKYRFPATIFVVSGQVGSTKIKGELALSGADDFVVQPVQRNDFVNLFKLIDGAQLRSNRILMHEVDFDDILQWTVQDVGDKVQSETTVDGAGRSKPPEESAIAVAISKWGK